tara:strand:+ start:1704 stop:1910 length:207 start_codon:yes stop_codon:yes gene_type:complete
MDCDLKGILNNITHNCETDIEIIKDNCKVICLISITKALNMCYFQMMETGLLEQMKEILKYCYTGIGH